MIQLKGITKAYKTGKMTIHAVNDVSLQVAEGEIFGLIGHSGAGKSTLLRCINLLEVPDAGEVWLDGVPLHTLSKRPLQQARRQIGMIFQHFHLLDSATVRDNIAFPLKLAGVARKEIDARVDELLNLVGLANLGRKYPAQLSGGQKQRVGIARALANRPKVLLCDEATSALDPQTTQSILDLLLDINREMGLTIVVVTHEMSVVQRMCDAVAVMEGGRVVEEGQVTDVFLDPQHALTKAMLEAERSVPDAAPARSEDSVLLQVSYVGDITYQPVLVDAARETNSTFSILRGTVDSVKGVPFGRLTVEWFGTPDVVQAAVHVLQHRGCHVKQAGITEDITTELEGVR